ncbi:DinB family protein [Chitinophagaceae bacterium MMS25-I14]
MENNQIQETAQAGIITAENLLKHWMGHRNITRRMLEAFPADKLFDYSIGGMRAFSELAKEIMSLSSAGLRGIVTGDWAMIPELDYSRPDASVKTKEELLHLWDKVTGDINYYWSQIQPESFENKIKAFGAYEGTVLSTILYIIDNEIHHRGQGYVYLRSLGIEPPAFWDRN